MAKMILIIFSFSAVVERTPHDQEVMGSNTAKSWPFFLLLSFLFVDFPRKASVQLLLCPTGHQPDTRQYLSDLPGQDEEVFSQRQARLDRAVGRADQGQDVQTGPDRRRRLLSRAHTEFGGKR